MKKALKNKYWEQYQALKMAQEVFDLNPTLSTLDKFETARAEFAETCMEILCTVMKADKSVLEPRD